MARPGVAFSLDDPATLENLRRYLAPPAQLDTPEDVSGDPAALGATVPPQAAPTPSPPEGMDMTALAQRFLAARQQGQREAWANHAGAVLDAAGRNILSAAGVNTSPVVQDRPALADKPVQDLEAQTRLEMMARKTGGQPARAQKSTDATSPESRAAQKALLAQFRDLTPADVADVPEAYAERFAVNHNAALDRASREKSLTSQEQREQARLEQQAKEGTLNRSVQWARLRQQAEEENTSLDFRRWLYEQEQAAKEKERAARDAEKKDEKVNTATQKLGEETVKAGIPEAMGKINDLKTIFAKYPKELPGIGLAAGMVPSRFEGEDSKRLRMLIGQLGATYQKAMTGAGASDAERKRYDEATGLVQRGDSDSIRLGVSMMEQDLRRKQAAIEGAYEPEAVETYHRRVTGKPPRTPAASTLPVGSDGQPTLDTPPARPIAPKYKPPPPGMKRVRFPGGQVRDVPANKLREAITRYNAVEVNE